MDFLGYVEKAGPFTAPLCLACLWAMRWLTARLEAAETRERAAVAANASLQVESMRAYGDAARLIEQALGETDGKIDAISQKLDRLKP